MIKPLSEFIALVALLTFASPRVSAGGIDGRVLTVYLVQGGVHVKLYDNKNILRGATDTDVNGFYRFVNAEPGTYRLRFVGERVQPTTTEPFTVSEDSVSNSYLVRPSTAALLAAARATARWSPNEFVQFVTQSKQWFVGDNEIYSCAQSLSAAATSAAFSMLPSAAQNQQTAADVAARTGAPPEMARQVANNMSAPLADVAILALDTTELSRSIRGLINGDSSPYIQTHLYQFAVSQVLPAQQLVAAGEQMFPEYSGLGAFLRLVSETFVFESTFAAAHSVCG